MSTMEALKKNLVLKDLNGQVIRAFNVNAEKAYIVRRQDSRRLMVVNDLETLTKNKIQFESLGEMNLSLENEKPFAIKGLGQLEFVERVGETHKSLQLTKENEKIWHQSIFAMFMLTAGFISVVFNSPVMTPKIEEELKQQVVQITKKIPPPVVKMQNKVSNFSVSQSSVKATTTKTKIDAVKRSGALSALGSLSQGKQKGGLNLGSAQVSPGVGLGGTEGSGGVQTSLYAKGIVGAPLGSGGNLQGAGGYGTKGKGGGQAGYGKLSLVGSTGVSPIPLGSEAVIAGGLDRDTIAAVIQKNLGQVRFCYEQGLQSDPSLNGRVAVGFVIGGTGTVKSTSIESSSINSKIVEDCLSMRVKSWKFPLPQGGVDVKVSYPFVLRRAGQG